MPWKSRRAILFFCSFTLLSAAALTLGPRLVEAQMPPVPPGGKQPYTFGNIVLPKDDELAERTEQAIDNVRAKQWRTAVETVQSLLGREEDRFVPLTRRGADGQERTNYVSVKREASRLLGQMPQEGKATYESLYGAQADKLVKSARTNNDAVLMAQVVALYFHTEAGLEAANWLGTYLLDRGDFMGSARLFQLLLERNGIRSVSLQTLIKAAYVFHSSGDTLARDAAFAELERRGEELPLRGGNKTVAEVRDSITAISRVLLTTGADDVPLFGGRPARSSLQIGGVPFLEASWRHPTWTNEETRRRIQEGERLLNETPNQSKPVLPGAFPLAVAAQKGEQRVPMVITRTADGIYARYLKETGKSSAGCRRSAG